MARIWVPQRLGSPDVDLLRSKANSRKVDAGRDFVSALRARFNTAPVVEYDFINGSVADPYGSTLTLSGGAHFTGRSLMLTGGASKGTVASAPSLGTTSCFVLLFIPYGFPAHPNMVYAAFRYGTDSYLRSAIGHAASSDGVYLRESSNRGSTSTLIGQARVGDINAFASSRINVNTAYTVMNEQDGGTDSTNNDGIWDPLTSFGYMEANSQATIGEILYYGQWAEFMNSPVGYAQSLISMTSRAMRAWSSGFGEGVRLIGSGVAADTDPPVVGTPDIDPNGVLLTIPFDEIVQNSTGFSATASGAAVTLSAPVVSDNSIQFTTSMINAGQTVLLSYSPGDVQDAAGNALVAFSDLTVDNQSTQGIVETGTVSNLEYNAVTATSLTPRLDYTVPA